MLVEIRKFNKEEVATCTSLDVAETFGKEHYHVIEDIRNLSASISSPDISGLFSESYYVATNGKKNPMYYMTRDGFTLLVMGYTGEKAIKFKLAYIKQFNAMENALIGKMKEREKGKRLQIHFSVPRKTNECMDMRTLLIQMQFTRRYSGKMRSSSENYME